MASQKVIRLIEKAMDNVSLAFDEGSNSVKALCAIDELLLAFNASLEDGKITIAEADLIRGKISDARVLVAQQLERNCQDLELAREIGGMAESLGAREKQ